ncbi:MAG TPA: calcium-binding protein [Tepidisphaeraceae bacterium]|nr:calcium-binding protein [Tepidisphaeraceae bacterium]
MFETLEPRRLFAATITDDGLLRINGTTENDRIEIALRHTGTLSSPQRYFVFINDVQVKTFSFESVKRVRINALEGDDHVATNVVAFCHVEGGAGNDTLVGGNAWETLNGGDGNDLLFGGGGNDLIAGGAGHDKLRGDGGGALLQHDGNDTLEGGPGNDILSGGGGADQYLGGSGIDVADYEDRSENVLIAIGTIILPPDWPVGGFGSSSPQPGAYLAKPYPQFGPMHYTGTGWLEGDVIETDVENARGGSGNDVLWGSGGDNLLEGGDGNDHLFGGLGVDSLYGDAGNDRLFAADRTDAMPGIGTQPLFERAHGGGGIDYAMVDWSDSENVAMIDRLEVLPFLTS